MALSFQNEFVVAAPAAATWRTLLDLERVAGCLPGNGRSRGRAAAAPGQVDGLRRAQAPPLPRALASTLASVRARQSAA